MREILFRGKRKDNGEWLEGYLFHDVDSGETEIQFMQYETDDYGVECWRNGYEVDPETVGQFTGMTDKNGTRIFEGDIIRLGGDDLPHWYKEGETVVVKCDNRYTGYQPLCDYDSDCGTFVESTECEVIGNIHDNPELLGVVDYD